jgi:hypothetical protein
MQKLKITYKFVYTVTWRPKAGIMEPEETSMLDNGSVNMFHQRRNNVTKPLLGQQILGKHPVIGRRKHILVGTLFSAGPTRGLHAS